MNSGRWITQTELSICLNEVLAVWINDLRSEFRTRYAINAILMFAVTTLITVSFSIGSFSINEQDKPFLYPVLLWIILVFSALSGLSRSFVKEQEAGTMDVLRLSARASGVFIGKLLFNLTLLTAIEFIIVPLFILLMDYKIEQPFAFTAVIMSAGFGLGAGATMIGAMIAQASARGPLFSALCFPLLLPVMIIAVKGCEKAATGTGLSGWHEAGITGCYAVIMIVVSLFLFPLIWEE
jgi:heme exporter protein B